ncbi:sulfotransferase [Alphaproteobacteria bacterium]|nr:sulfotransferase [Alphaproteobacteria bacterium]
MPATKVRPIAIDHQHTEVMGYGQRLPFFYFVGGLPRSGTTWVMHLLHSHPALCCIGEGLPFGTLSSFLADAITKYNRTASPENTRKMLPLKGIDGLGARRVFETALMELMRVNTDKQLDQLTGIGEKTPDNLIALQILWNNIPDARFINVIRDCRDVIVSGWYRFQPNLLDYFSSREHYTREVAKAWSDRITNARAEAAGRDPRLYHEIRYEDLLTDPETAIRNMLDFLMVDSDETTIAAAIEAGRFDKHSGGRTQGMADTNDDHAHFRKGVHGEWRQEFTAVEKQSAWEMAGPLLQTLGYSKD